MTERCQTEFTEKFDNQIYVIYIGILCTSVAVLYFYRLHFVTIAFSYLLGCLACYYGLNSTILNNYVGKLKYHIFGDITEDAQKEPIKGCLACGSKECTRHDTSTNAEPWVGLQIHKQLDQAIEDFYNTILDHFINTWYSKITLRPFFVDELRHQLRYASSCLLQRAIKINYSRFLTERLIPCALRHYSLWCEEPVRERGCRAVVPVHPAAANRTAELDYLRCVTDALMPYLLRNQELKNTVFHVLIREIFAGWVLLSLTDVLADPYILNTLIILATGDETMAELPTTPNYKVEFLETFVRQSDSLYAERCKLLKVDLELVINDQDYFYAFMQYMKNTSHIHLLQFYKDIKSFQIKILNPELSEAEKATLHKEASDLYSLYISKESVSRVPLEPALAEELYELLQSSDSVRRDARVDLNFVPVDDMIFGLVGTDFQYISRLQTSRALYQAARQSHSVLEKIMLPRFLHSEEFYNLVIGSRVPTGYQKNMNRKPQERLLNTALRLGNKLKGALKPQSIDGQVLDCFTNTEDSEGEGVDNIDILKYLDSIAAEDSLRGNDLSNYKVVLTNVEIRLQAAPRRGTVRVFSLAVHRLEPGGTASFWSVERSEHDFHLLRSKLHEFHGDSLLLDLPLPSRRDNSPLEILRYKYEDFVQRLLQKSLLQTSELLRIFLTEDGDFSVVVQASTLNATSTDLANIYQSVTHKLRKEKGQHLEAFLRNLLVSSDMERYQALKQGTTARDVEEAQEVSEEADEELLHSLRQRRARNIHASIFGDNFGIEPAIEMRGAGYQTVVVGFTHCFMYLLSRVVRARALLCALCGTLLQHCRTPLDQLFNLHLNSLLSRLLSERRLAHLIRLGHGLLFGKKASQSRSDPSRQRELARAQLLEAIPQAVGVLTGPGITRALSNAFDIIQRPDLNKQLVYNLLDLCIAELFPELINGEAIATRVPKS